MPRAMDARHRLTHLQPETHCPLEMNRHTFEQIAADLDVPDLLVRLMEVRDHWDRLISPTQSVGGSATF